MPDKTLEELQEENLNLRNQIRDLESERDDLKTTNETLDKDLNHARKVNSRLLEQISAGTDPEEDEPAEPELRSWEEIAKSIPIK